MMNFAIVVYLVCIGGSVDTSRIQEEYGYDPKNWEHWNIYRYKKDGT